jgi:hypothetical protein
MSSSTPQFAFSSSVFANAGMTLDQVRRFYLRPFSHVLPVYSYGLSRLCRPMEFGCRYAKPLLKFSMAMQARFDSKNYIGNFPFDLSRLLFHPFNLFAPFQ